MAKIYWIVLFSFIAVLVNCDELKDDQCPETDDCNLRCDSDSVRRSTMHVPACKQGCIFNSISFASKKDSTDGKSHMEHCKTSCEEAFKEDCDKQDCCSGCQFLEDSVAELKKDHKESNIQDKKSTEETTEHVLHPIAQFKKVLTKVMEGIKIVKVYLVTLFTVDDTDDVVVVEVPKETVIDIDLKKLVKGRAGGAKDVDCDDIDGDEEEEQETKSESLVHRGRVGVERLSVRLGIPPFVVILSFVCLMVFLSYMTVVFVSSLCRKKTNKKNFALPIPPKTLPIQLVRPEDLTKLSLIDEDELQAPELPPKPKIPEDMI